jgi:hypothetical protein
MLPMNFRREMKRFIVHLIGKMYAWSLPDAQKFGNAD